ncbi:MAG: winged helix-turn-helix domain-containing protein [Reyranella sp.]|nr:winged helix-turn-helix domain-containing protein [Reyranella sp.]
MTAPPTLSTRLGGVDVLAHRMRVVIAGQRGFPLDAEAKAQRYDSLTLFPGTARARWRLQDVELTMTEYKIVMLLVSHRGKLLTYRAIYDAAHYTGFVAGTGELGHHVNVRSMVKRIRKKFLAIDPGFAEIENVESAGYLWRDPARAPTAVQA